MYQILEGLAAGLVAAALSLFFLFVVAIVAGAFEEGRHCSDGTYRVKTVSEGFICVVGQPL